MRTALALGLMAAGGLLMWSAFRPNPDPRTAFAELLGFGGGTKAAGKGGPISAIGEETETKASGGGGGGVW